MKSPIFRYIGCLLSLISISAYAGSPVNEDFASNAIPEQWRGVKGEWTAKDGALHGKELKSDSHAAVFTIPAQHGNSSIQFRFQVNGAKGFHLSYNHAKGHLFRIRAVDGKISLVMDKDKKDPSSKAVTLQDAELEFESGKWYDLSCNVKGTEVEVTCGDLKLSGSHPNLSKGKTGFRFIVQGASVVIDDISYSTVRS